MENYVHGIMLSTTETVNIHETKYLDSEGKTLFSINEKKVNSTLAIDYFKLKKLISACLDVFNSRIGDQEVISF